MNKTICIVGAGSGGICAARRCHEERFSKITVFEQSNTVGGLWNYTNETGVHSSMYKNLRYEMFIGIYSRDLGPTQ
jgi:cation diffusion facilitator CzcD-associated flavoprotein CzcO